MSKTDHIRIMNWHDGSYRMLCEHCGRHAYITPPVSLGMASVMMKQFAREHRRCQKSTDPETAERLKQQANTRW